MRALLVATFLLAVGTSTARADDVAAAGRAFADGQAAQLDGDYDHAAQSFELAFSIAPAREALRSAVRARQLAGQLARAATLAEILLAKYGDDPVSAKLASDVIADAAPKLARIVVACADKCTLAIGGRALSLSAAQTHTVYVPPGKQTLELTFDDAQSTTRDVIGVAGEERKVEVAHPIAKPAPAPIHVVHEPTPPSPTPRSSRGLSPAIVVVGGVLTLGLAGATAWSGHDTTKAYDAYAADPAHPHDAFVAGQSKQLRTNILLGSTIGTGIVTIAIAALWTHWRSEETSSSVAIETVAHGGGVLTFGGRF